MQESLSSLSYSFKLYIQLIEKGNKICLDWYKIAFLHLNIANEHEYLDLEHQSDDILFDIVQ